MMRSEQKIVVVGGGVIGLACAWELLRAGASVTVVDRGRPGAATSRVAAGMLAPVGELEFGETELMEMGLASLRMYPDWVEALERESGLEVDYLRCGALHLALDRDEAAELRRRHEFQLTLGIESEWLGPGAVRRLEPGIAAGTHGGIHVKDDAVVDPRTLTAALLAAVEAAGGAIVEAGVEGLVLEGDRVAGVRLEDGRELPATEVLAATGALPGSADWLPQRARPAVRPVKGQILELRGDPAAPVCERIVEAERVYIVPRSDGRVIVGATVEELGHDVTVTAGGVLELLREAYRTIPEIAELELVEATAGLRPGTPDNLPIVGPTGIDGLTVATGHYRNGILLAPITGRAVAELLATGGTELPVAAASPERFAPSPQEVA